MKLTEKQAQMLYQVLMGSLDIVNLTGIDRDSRRKLAEDILNQQDDETMIDLTAPTRK